MNQSQSFKEGEEKKEKQFSIKQFLEKTSYCPIFPNRKEGTKIRCIMIMGKTRVGKSTFSELLLRKELRANQFANVWELVYSAASAGNRTIKSGIDSFTHEPNIYEYEDLADQKDYQTYIIDNPGLRDQSYIRRILNSYFIGQVVDKLDQIHLYVILNHPTLDTTEIAILKEVMQMFPSNQESLRRHITLLVNNVTETGPQNIVIEKIKTHLIKLISEEDKKTNIAQSLRQYYATALENIMIYKSATILTPDERSKGFRIKDEHKKPIEQKLNYQPRGKFNHADISDGGYAANKGRFEREMKYIETVIDRSYKEIEVILEGYNKQKQQIVENIESVLKNKVVKDIKFDTASIDSSEVSQKWKQQLPTLLTAQKLCSDNMTSEESYYYFLKMILQAIVEYEKNFKQLEGKLMLKQQSIAQVLPEIFSILLKIEAIKQWMQKGFNKQGIRLLFTRSHAEQGAKTYIKKISDLYYYMNVLIQIKKIVGDPKNQKLPQIKQIMTKIKTKTVEFITTSYENFKFTSKNENKSRKVTEQSLRQFNGYLNKKFQQYITSNIKEPINLKVSKNEPCCCLKVQSQSDIHANLAYKLVGQCKKLLQEPQKQQQANNRKVFQIFVSSDNILNGGIPNDGTKIQEIITQLRNLVEKTSNQLGEKRLKKLILKLALIYEKQLPKDYSCLNLYKEIKFYQKIEDILLNQTQCPREATNFDLFIEYGDYFKQLSQKQTSKKMYYCARQCNTQFDESKQRRVESKQMSEI